MISPINLSKSDASIKDYAVQGLLTCQENESRLGIIKQIAIQILFTGALAATIYAGLPVAIPVVLGVGFLGVTAYTIYRYLIRQESRMWRHIFENIIQSNYSQAFNELEKISKSALGDKGDHPGRDGTACGAAIGKITNLVIADYRWSHPVYFAYLYAHTALQKAAKEYRENNHFSNTDLDRQWDLWSSAIRDHVYTTDFNFIKSGFDRTEVRNQSTLLLYTFLKEIRNLNSNMFTGDDPTDWGGGNWKGDGKETLRYLSLIKKHRWNELADDEKVILEKLLKRKNLKEIWSYSQSLSEIQMDHLKAKAAR